MKNSIETYRGSVNSWECDDIGHMNVQFYVARASDAGFSMRQAMGLGPSKVRAEGRTMVALEEHIRFLRELREADMMIVRSGIVEMRERTALVFHEFINPETGEPAATMQAVTGHFDLKTRKLTPWPDEIRARAAHLKVEVPEHGRARGVERERRFAPITLEQATERGLIDIYRGGVMPVHCDDFGHMNTQFYMGRFSEGAYHLWHQLGLERGMMRDNRLGTVVLEGRLNYMREVLSGSVLAIKSALIEVGAKTLRLAHFMFDGETGELVATSEVIGILFDLEKRRSVALTLEQIDLLAPRVTEMDYA